MADDALTAGPLGLSVDRSAARSRPAGPEPMTVDRYLANLRRELRHEPDLEDIMDEVADHLHAAVQRHASGGASHDQAVNRALASFGGTDTVSEGFKDRATTGVGMPTPMTRLAGLALRVAAFALPLALVSFWASDRVETATGVWEGGASRWGTVGAILLLAGNGLGAWGGGGLLARHGLLRAPLGAAALVLLGLGVLVSLAVWLVVAWTAVMGLGWIAVVQAARGRTDLPAPTVRALQFGYLLACLGAVAGAILGEPESQWEAFGSVPGVLMVAAGYFSAGSHLASEFVTPPGGPAATA